MTERRVCRRLNLPIATTLAIIAAVGAPARSADPPKKQIVCTFLPMYVFTLNVVGDTPGIDVRLLISSDLGCPHDYAVRPADMKLIADADLIIANGLGMEPFLVELLKPGNRATVLTVSGDCDPIRIAEKHDHAPGEKCDHDHGSVNGHVWTSPGEAIKQVNNLARQLGQADPERASRYLANAEAYSIRLRALKKEFADAAAEFTRRRIVTTHDAFAYMARDLGLEVVAVLESEPGKAPSAGRMAATVDTIRSSGAAAVFYEPSSSTRVAQTIAREAGISAYSLNPFNSLRNRPIADSYETVMRENLTTLRKALRSDP